MKLLLLVSRRWTTTESSSAGMCSELTLRGMLQMHKVVVAVVCAVAVDFFNSVRDVAEAEGHHPDLHLTNYREVQVRACSSSGSSSSAAMLYS